MVRKHVALCFLTMLAVFAMACGGNKDSTPQKAMEQLKDAFASLDPAKLEACYDADSWKSKGADMTKEFKKMKEDGMTVTLTWAESDITVSGDTATVKAKMKFKTKDGKEEDENETVNLKKTEAGWKATR